MKPFIVDTPRAWLVLLALALLLSAACNPIFDTAGGDGNEPAPATVALETVAPTATEPPNVTYVIVTSTTTATPTPTHTPDYTATPTATPTASLTPAPTVIAALIREDVPLLRLRETPGTAGTIITQLEAETPLQIVGRTADNSWVQVIAPDGRTGWMYTAYLEVNVDLAFQPITGEAENAPGPQAVGTGPDGVSPVVSNISSHAREIVLRGRELGNLPGVFAKIGDSITFAPGFMTMLGYDYNLANYAYLRPALTFFYGPNGRGENPFSATSAAAIPGWRTIELLQPGASPASYCGGDEIPIICEYRTARPSVALIMVGTNDSDGRVSLEQYRANLNRIVEITINQGVVPVLSLLPPMRVGDAARDARNDQMNVIIRETATAWDIPLWHYYEAMMTLPNLGLAADGGHPSDPPDGRYADFDAEHLQYGYNMRNLTGLQVLYELWRLALYDADPNAAPVDPGTTTNTTGNEQTNTASAGPGVADCPGVLPTRLSVGALGRVTPGLANNVRAEPNTGAAAVGQMDPGTAFTVVGGPECGEGYTWWYVQVGDLVGWTAAASASEYYVEPAS